MRYQGATLACGLLLTQACAALPSNRFILARQASSGSATSSASQPSFTSSISVSGNSTLSVAERLGIPPLSHDDELFILEEKLVQEAGVTKRRRATTNVQDDYNTPTKWADWYMDEWLEGWAQETSVNGVLLKDSKQFLKDFWSSTRDETIFPCKNILDNCAATKPDNNGREDIKWDDRLRAFYARQAIQIWHTELKEAHTIMNSAMLESQTMTREIREAFVADPAVKPGNWGDVIVPSLAIFGLLYPPIAPVAALIGGVYALDTALHARDAEEVVTITIPGDDQTSTVLQTRSKPAAELPKGQVVEGQSASQPAAQGSGSGSGTGSQPAAQGAGSGSGTGSQPAAQGAGSGSSSQPASQGSGASSGSQPAAQPASQGSGDKGQQGGISQPSQPQSQPQQGQGAKKSPPVRQQIINLEEIPKPKAGDSLEEVEKRVKKLEDDAAKGKEVSFEKAISSMKTAGDFMDKAAKVITAFKALKPGLPKPSTTEWTFFDGDVLTIFKGYVDAVEQSYLVNIDTWDGKERTARSGVTVAASGMKYILGGGAWFKPETSYSEVSKVSTNLLNFFRKIILSEVLKAQSIHLWRQHFDDKAACETALKVYKDEDLIGAINVQDQCFQVGQGVGSWELRIARKPYAHSDKDGNQAGTFVKVGATNGNNYFQKTGDFQENSAGYPKWTSARLKDAKIGLDTNEIWKLSEECRSGDNIFDITNRLPTASDRYKSMQFSPASGDLNLENPISIPKCLFSLPIMDINRGPNDWCKDHVGHLSQSGFAGWGPSSFAYKANDKKCASHEEYGWMADWYMCLEGTGPYDSTRVPQPGCSKHETAGYRPFPLDS